MERLTKIAFYVGIGIAVSVFALFLIWSLPVVIGHTGNQWERLGNTDTDRSNGETLAKFQEHPAYVAMYERFPGAVEKVEYLEDGGGSIEVGAMNFENNGQLVLHMYYIYSNDVHAEVTCMNDAMDRQTHVDDLLAERFIRNTDCLEYGRRRRNLECGLDCASTARPSSRPVKSQPVSGRSACSHNEVVARVRADPPSGWHYRCSAATLRSTPPRDASVLPSLPHAQRMWAPAGREREYA